MTIVHDITRPEQLLAAFVAAFNAADSRAIERSYEDVHFAGTATDVARRGADGHWRYVIDKPVRYIVTRIAWLADSANPAERSAK